MLCAPVARLKCCLPHNSHKSFHWKSDCVCVGSSSCSSLLWLLAVFFFFCNEQPLDIIFTPRMNYEEDVSAPSNRSSQHRRRPTCYRRTSVPFQHLPDYDRGKHPLISKEMSLGGIIAAEGDGVDRARVKEKKKKKHGIRRGKRGKASEGGGSRMF